MNNTQHEIYAASNNDDGQHEFRRLISIVKRRWLVVFVVTVIFVFVGVSWLRAQPDMYEAETLLIVQPQRSRFQAIESTQISASMYFFYNNEMHTQLLLIKSYAVVTRAMAQLKPEHRALLNIEDEKKAITKILGMYKAEQVEKTRQISIKVRSKIAQLCAPLADAIAKAYMDEMVSQQSIKLEETQAAYKERIPEVAKKLNDAETRLLEFRTLHKIASSDSPEKVLAQEEADLVEQLSAARYKRIDVEAQLKAISSDGVIGKPHPELVNGIATDDAWVRHLLDKRLAKKIELDQLKRSFAEGHTSLDTATNALGAIDRELTKAAKSHYERLMVVRGSALWAEKELSNLLKDVRINIVVMSKVLAQYASLQKRRDSYIKMIEELEQSQLDLSTAKNLELAFASIIQKSSVPKTPVSRQTIKYILAAFILGVCLSVVIIFTLELLNDSLRTPDELEKAIPSRMLTAIAAMKKRNIFPLAKENTIFTEQFRALRTGLLTSSVWANTEGGKVVLITSPNVSEGKTTVSLNTASVFAQLGMSVVVLGGDMRKPRVHEIMAAAREPGLSDFLMSDVGIDDIIKITGVDNLSIIPAGKQTDGPAELLASSKFIELIKELRSRFDVVVIDSPPVLLVADTPSIAKSADIILMVARCDETRRGILIRSYDILKNVSDRPIFSVFNYMSRSAGRAYGHKSYFATKNADDAPPK